MIKTDLVTIAIPVYERVDFFQEALDSALNQTVKCKIVVSDNGSSHDIFGEICAKYPDLVEYHKNKENIGMFPNWNKCVEYVRTPYMLILGDDDILHESFVETFLGVHECNPDIEMFYSEYELVFEPSKEKCKNPLINYWGGGTMYDVKKQAVNSYVGFPSISCVCKVDLYRTHPFEERIHGTNDWLSIYSFPNDVKIYGCNKIMYDYRKHNQADTSSAKMKNVMRLNHLLILNQLTSEVQCSFYIKLKWQGNLNLFRLHHGKFVNNYLQTESGYRELYNRFKSKNTIVTFLLSLLIGLYDSLKFSILRK